MSTLTCGVEAGTSTEAEHASDVGRDDHGLRSWGSSTREPRTDYSYLLRRQYHSTEFLTALLELLRDDLRIPGWSGLPSDIPSSLLHIHKVSGSLTNAVFFVSIPAMTLEINSSAVAAPTPQRATPASFAAEMEAGRSTPTPGGTARRASHQQASSITIEAPTLLLRIYGPSSGSLISRRTELHILHTLSSDYAIGPKVLGTFSNGRVEEYFHSRALHKEEMRDARVSRWIGRRMRELHRVELEKMEVPGGSRNSSLTRVGELERPPLDVGGRGPGSSSASIYSTSSGSSIFSFGTSAYSNSSAGSTTSLATLGSEYGTPVTSSPLLLPRGGSSESRADSKKRSRSLMSSRGRRANDKLGVWENITRWTREAKLVLKELDQLASLPGFSDLLAPPPPSLSSTLLAEPDHVAPLSSPALTFALRAALNLPLFEQQVKLYRTFVHEWEKKEGKSKRVFSHNDTQYGNLLLLTPKEGDERALERSIQVPHHRIIVVDFEYASANPRGFDIGPSSPSLRPSSLTSFSQRTTLSNGKPTTTTRPSPTRSSPTPRTLPSQNARASSAPTSAATRASTRTRSSRWRRRRIRGSSCWRTRCGYGNLVRMRCGPCGGSCRRRRTCWRRWGSGGRSARGGVRWRVGWRGWGWWRKRGRRRGPTLIILRMRSGGSRCLGRSSRRWGSRSNAELVIHRTEQHSRSLSTADAVKAVALQRKLTRGYCAKCEWGISEKGNDEGAEENG